MKYLLYCIFIPKSTQNGCTFGITECSKVHLNKYILYVGGGQWLSGRINDSRQKGREARLSWVVFLSLELVQPRKTCSEKTEILLTGT